MLNLSEGKTKAFSSYINSRLARIGMLHMKDKNMKPDESGREMLLYIRKDLDNEEIAEPNGFDETQLYELLLDGGTAVIASIY